MPCRRSWRTSRPAACPTGSCSSVAARWAAPPGCTRTAVGAPPGTPAARPFVAHHRSGCRGDKRQKAALRLARRPDALVAKLFTPGKSGDSRLIHLVAATDPDDRMPPDGTPLTREQVGFLRAWIDQG